MPSADSEEVSGKSVAQLFQMEILEFKKVTSADNKSDPSGIFVRLIGLLYVRFTMRNFNGLFNVMEKHLLDTEKFPLRGEEYGLGDFVQQLLIEDSYLGDVNFPQFRTS